MLEDSVPQPAGTCSGSSFSSASRSLFFDEVNARFEAALHSSPPTSGLVLRIIIYWSIYIPTVEIRRTRAVSLKVGTYRSLSVYPMVEKIILLWRCGSAWNGLCERADIEGFMLTGLNLRHYFSLFLSPASFLFSPIEFTVLYDKN